MRHCKQHIILFFVTTSGTEVLGGDEQLVSNIPTASNCDEEGVQAS